MRFKIVKNYLPGSLGESAKAWDIKQHKISGEFQDRHQDRLFLRGEGKWRWRGIPANCTCLCKGQVSLVSPAGALCPWRQGLCLNSMLLAPCGTCQAAGKMEMPVTVPMWGLCDARHFTALAHDSVSLCRFTDLTPGTLSHEWPQSCSCADGVSALWSLAANASLVPPLHSTFQGCFRVLRGLRG